MFKKIFIFHFIFLSLLFGQNATQYLPTKIGAIWHHNAQALDSLSNPTGPVVDVKTENVAYQNFLGKLTLFQISSYVGQSGVDTTWLAPEGSNVNVHLNKITFDSIVIGNYPDWLSVFRFTSTINTVYTIHQQDTTIQLDTLSLPLRFKLTGKRLTSETITVPYGTFNCVKFQINFLVQYKITLPPPLPPIYQTIFDMPSTYWFADSLWEVKFFRETVNFTIPTTTRGFTIPGQIRELTSFGSTINATINYNAGWNLISVPLKANDMSKNSLFPTSVSAAYSYDNGYITKDTLVNGTGYWLKFNNSSSQTITGQKPTNRNIIVKAGWNLIGPFETNVPVSQITQIPAGIVQSSYYGYNNGYVVSDTLNPGKGYWVKVSQNGILSIPASIK